MKKIFITGATGNVGKEIIKNLTPNIPHAKIIAGVKDKENNLWLNDEGIETVYFDFLDIESIQQAFHACDVLFLLRPPQLADVEKYFKPLVEIAIEKNIQHIVFLSVQGAETSSKIPHHKIEQLLIDSKIPYTFLRPAYFMQNFTTTLHKELTEQNSIFLPAGKAKFTLIDTQDLGAVAAKILLHSEKHLNAAYDLTNAEQLNFYEMADILSEELERKIEFVNPNLISFFLKKWSEKMPIPFIFVMIMLHYLPRFKPTPKTSEWVAKILGKAPKTFRDFVRENKDVLTAS